MNSFTFNAAGEADTAALGTALAELLPGGTTVALCGTLGAGKTRLVQAIARAEGVEQGSVVSPTFVLIQEYRGGRRAIYHIDSYRLRDEDEFLQLGPEEYFEQPDALVFVEWADRVADCLPGERIQIEIEVTGPESRRFRITARGEKYAETIRRLAGYDMCYPRRLRRGE